MITVAIVGQTPPPFGGQAVMIEHLLSGKYRNVRLVHVRMAFSKKMDSAGRFKVSKLWELFSVLTRIVVARVWKMAQVLYYPPAGPDLVPVWRDIVLLVVTRWMFRATIFHFHASGLSEVYETIPRPLRFLFRVAYSRPDVAVCMSGRTAKDAKFLKSRQEFIVPYGIEDDAARWITSRNPADVVAHILFVGVLREDKGIFVLIRACHLLFQAGVRFRVTCVGEFGSEEFRSSLMKYLATNGLTECIAFPGVLSGDAKFAAYSKADIFCFPSFFHSEAFPVVLLEALSFALPIVCTDWRGIPDIVDDRCAFLVPIQDEFAVADKLRVLIENPDQRHTMGMAGRKRFLERFTLERYFASLQPVFEHLEEKLDRP